jgi:hypothetical protein
MEAYIEGGKGYVKVESDYLTAAAVINQARIITPDLKSQQLDLQPVAPGIYAGNFKVQEPGVYLINVVQKKGDDVIGSVSGGAALSYSPEYNNTNQDESFLKTGGSYRWGKYYFRAWGGFCGQFTSFKRKRGALALASDFSCLSLTSGYCCSSS